MDGKKPLYSILITTYECHGHGVQFIKENLNAIVTQTYRPIQVVVSDHSRDDAIEQAVSATDTSGVEIIYKRYTEHYGSPCHNWNNTLLYATGDYLHYFALDDRLRDEHTVGDIVTYAENNRGSRWFATGNIVEPRGNTFMPSWNDTILSKNTLSGPSAIVLRKDLRHIQLDPTFIYFLDLDWYYRLYKEAGVPNCIKRICWINRFGTHNLTNTVCTSQSISEERKLLIAKYGDPLPRSPA